MKYSALEGYGNQYWPINSSILSWRTPLTEKAGRPQSTKSQRVEHVRRDPACIDARLYACGSFAPVRVDPEGGAAAWLSGTLGAKCARAQTASVTGLMTLSESFFKFLVAGDQKAPVASVSLHL